MGMNGQASTDTTPGFACRTFDLYGMTITTNLTVADIKRRPDPPHYNRTHGLNAKTSVDPGRVFFKSDGEAYAFCNKIRKR